MQYNIDNQSNANLNQSQYMSDADQEMFFQQMQNASVQIP